MSLVDVDTWLQEHDACERLGHDILSQIVLRDRQPLLSAEYSTISTSIRNRLKQFSSELKQLKAKLNLCIENQTSEEFERRQHQIEALQSKKFQLKSQFSNVPGQSIRSDLFSGGPSILWEDDTDDDESVLNKKNYITSDLRKQQRQIFGEQNASLEQLSRVITRQKELASRIGDEVNVQNILIDELGETMDRIDVRVNKSTAHITLVGERDSTCRYWSIILLLFTAIVILSIL